MTGGGRLLICEESGEGMDHTRSGLQTQSIPIFLRTPSIDHRDVIGCRLEYANMEWASVTMHCIFRWIHGRMRWASVIRQSYPSESHWHGASATPPPWHRFGTVPVRHRRRGIARARCPCVSVGESVWHGAIHALIGFNRDRICFWVFCLGDISCGFPRGRSADVALFVLVFRSELHVFWRNGHSQHRLLHAGAAG